MFLFREAIHCYEKAYERNEFMRMRLAFDKKENEENLYAVILVSKDRQAYYIPVCGFMTMSYLTDAASIMTYVTVTMTASTSTLQEM